MDTCSPESPFIQISSIKKKKLDEIKAHKTSFRTSQEEVKIFKSVSKKDADRSYSAIGTTTSPTPIKPIQQIVSGDKKKAKTSQKKSIQKNIKRQIP